jgi:hypothetical protein
LNKKFSQKSFRRPDNFYNLNSNSTDNLFKLTEQQSDDINPVSTEFENVQAFESQEYNIDTGNDVESPDRVIDYSGLKTSSMKLGRMTEIMQKRCITEDDLNCKLSINLSSMIEH